MAHVSRPLLIALAATVALMAVWVVALRPKPVAIDNTPLGATKAIPQAREAAAISDAANAKVQAATGNQAAPAGTAAPVATPAGTAAPAAAPAGTAAPAAAPAGAAAPAAAPPVGTPSAAKAAASANAAATGKASVSGNAAPGKAAANGNAASPAKTAAPAKAAKPSVGERRNDAIMRLVARGKVVVLLFWNPTASDDIATRGALRELDRRDGKVVVRVVPISEVAQYTSVTQGVKIAQSPTTVIIGRKGAARVISGLSEPRELSQAVGDALAGR